MQYDAKDTIKLCLARMNSGLSCGPKYCSKKSSSELYLLPLLRSTSNDTVSAWSCNENENNTRTGKENRQRELSQDCPTWNGFDDPTVGGEGQDIVGPQPRLDPLASKYLVHLVDHLRGALLLPQVVTALDDDGH